MNLHLLKKELEYVSHKVYEKGYTQATGGNISVRIPGTDHVLIKRSGVSLGEVSLEDALIVDMDGEVVEGQGKPSKEIGFHLGIYKVRPDVNAVVHCHPNYAIGYACLGMELPLPTVTARKLLGHVPVADEAPSGSQELASFVTDVFTKYPDIRISLMKDHGVCSVGKTLEEAYNVVDLAEATAKQAFIVSQLKATVQTPVTN
ncbi:class II aldolase/adducin family protein [Pontibacillus yanchengensis]|uniref:Class II aldolase/adducin family protein n=2 Tax=Pontibacillus yanchengensis TaxID=462910 RepID=A0A6I5A1D0_9BACI|nr:class II aldolase/adducin family protein [Pontibacillus yanchengensis]MYL34390.1 class II aldolase/adducin family protein [Pontibacillus yanchengensis]MYL53858.1 class II aldolase/adducin family protein [Pontibacillus yanchengensis]